MAELGAYAESPWESIGRLKYELLRTVRLVVDTGIHDRGWDFEQTVDYVMENAGDDRGTAEYRVLRYTAYPGQATAYMVGLLQLLDLRSAAEASLGDAFDLATFHDVLLGSGNIPLAYARTLVEQWLAGEATP